MYIPEHFKETNSERISSLIESNSFGVLVTAPDGVPFVSHLPFVFDHAAGSKGKLLGHMARANPQWQHFSSCGEVLAVFQGPHAYVSPSWYSSPGVPTWNYAVIHLRGKPRLIESKSELETLVERLTNIHESHMPNPWQPNLAGEQRTRLLSMIVGFEIEVTDIQAKFKLSQNRPPEDQQSVVEKLSESSNQIEAAVAELMSRVFHAKF
ncbi:MAG: FMN-binding negative transcriptional regulator [Candidatus Accumulibacter sp.]|uniref:FMN-binding negative transcriptional regulator n=1 Tax=Accumulibacter sp. TaxID=2053492 RepID=UPI001A08CD00|nr:FMN-binding negative transcriptional regulator [Accumulibacter sp.]MBE2260476.1 FMN-binding negative transcriptional regulator [Paracoccaceae bacterium]MCB1943367.1 FMN-binding negative transcriptional regulator [Accumulibacter sp.]MCP5249268.1 FMN-binding negative transcriptional regulator [Accumulibacter sp.]